MEPQPNNGGEPLMAGLVGVGCSLACLGYIVKSETDIDLDVTVIVVIE